MRSARRTGPSRLPSGAWSDGVNRDDAISECWRYSGDVERICVFKWSDEWHVDGGGDFSTFPTHVDALAHADSLALENGT